MVVFDPAMRTIGILEVRGHFSARVPEVVIFEPIELTSGRVLGDSFRCSQTGRVAAPRFYAVRRGSRPGVYTSWADCKDYVLRFPGARYKSFSSMIEAEFMLRDD